MLKIFMSEKFQRLRPGLNPQTWVPEASVLTTRPPKPSCNGLSKGQEQLSQYSDRATHGITNINCFDSRKKKQMLFVARSTDRPLDPPSFFPLCYSSQGVEHIRHLHLTPRLRMSGSIPLWCAQGHLYLYQLRSLKPNHQSTRRLGLESCNI